MSDQIMRDNLLTLAGAFARARGWSMSTVSKKIHGKQDFFDLYQVGKTSTRVSHYWMMVDKFREMWPPGTPWPRTVPIGKLGKEVSNAK